MCWFAALRRLLPATASMGNAAHAPVGVTTAAIALDEPFGAGEVLALILTLAGVTRDPAKGLIRQRGL